MKLNLDRHEFESEGFRTSRHASIAAKNTAKIFYMLTSGFYSRPRESMFRELCANALDERAYASKPFRVTLPTAYQEELVIRDYGRGMTHDFVMTRAMSLGDSTKDDSDEAIGGFGLGMKTPFCVTEQFSLVVYRGDHKQTYIIDRDGGAPRVMTDPSLREALEEPETGTELRIPVSYKERHEYEEIAQRILPLFPAGSFECFGLEITPPNYVSETATYALLAHGQAPTYALMGHIAYRLDLPALFGDAWRELNCPPTGLELRFAIGDLAVTPNREALLFNDQTRAAVRESVRVALDEIRASFLAEINSEPTLWGALTHWADTLEKAGEGGAFLPLKVQWQNSRWGVEFDAIETPDCIVSFVCRDLREYKSPRGFVKDKLLWQPSQNPAYRATCTRPQWLFVLDDLKDGAHKLYMQRAKMIVQSGAAAGCSRVAFIDAAFVEEMELIEEDYLLASDYTPPKAARSPRDYLTGRIMAYDNRQRTSKSLCGWGRAEISLLNGGVYVAFNGSTAEKTQDMDMSCSLRRYSSYRGVQVWGIPKSVRAKLDPAKWQSVSKDASAWAHSVWPSATRALRASLVESALADAVSGHDCGGCVLSLIMREESKDVVDGTWQRLRARVLKMTECDCVDASTLHDLKTMKDRLWLPSGLKFPTLPTGAEALGRDLLEFCYARPLFAALARDRYYGARQSMIADNLFWRSLEVKQ